MEAYEDSDLDDEIWPTRRRRPSNSRFLFWRFFFCLLIAVVLMFGLASLF
jgi:predicted nucleic acid-binding Zn ribbon protein